MCAGLAATRAGKPTVTEWTRKNGDKVRALNSALRDLPGWPAVFRWSALQIAHNTQVQVHSDANNVGPSAAVAVGAFVGGELVKVIPG